MMSLFRSLTACALALVLALTSLQMAAARGAGGPAGMMELCLGQGVVTVAVDAQGKPTGPVHFCPDCVMSLIVALDDTPPTVSRPQAYVALSHVITHQHRVGRTTRAARARGPPVLI
ncbi:hypothetical protein ACOXXX_05770 [Thalassococcus sp. BH17M4-6]|uniref:hypothetical protein n=1 Tax=Thalassococcus sp. BH17M4-6 TaxID=3413148 RepID=UPI003BD03600